MGTAASAEYDVGSIRDPARPIAPFRHVPRSRLRTVAYDCSFAAVTSVKTMAAIRSRVASLDQITICGVMVNGSNRLNCTAMDGVMGYGIKGTV